jgi:hypothetical protein
MHGQARFGGQFRRAQRIDISRGVTAIGHEDHDLVRRVLFTQAFDAEAQRIADGGLAPGDADHRFVQQLLHGLAIESERHLQVGLLPEQDQAQAIAHPPPDEFARHRLARREPVDGLVVQHEIALVHAFRQVDRQHEVAAVDRQLHRIAQPYGARGAGHEQGPRQRRQQHVGASRLGAAAARHQHFEVMQGWHAQRRALRRRGRWQVASQQPRQRQQHE